MFSELSRQGSQIDEEFQQILYTPFNYRDNDALDQHMARSDSLQLYRALQEINSELSNVQLENLVFIDFLETQDPKMLLGLDEAKASFIRQRQAKLARQTDRDSTSTIRADFETRSMSVAESAVGSIRRQAHEFQINYRTKAELAEKLALRVLKRCLALDKEGTQEVQSLKGEIEELYYRIADTKETIKIFKLHFIKNDTILNAKEREMEIHLRKFVNTWLRNGTALLSNMHLGITSLEGQSRIQEAALVTKADLGQMLSGVDFEQQQIERDSQIRKLDEKNISLAGLKEVTGRASLALAKEKKAYMLNEQKVNTLNQKIEDVKKRIAKMQQEALEVEKEIVAEERSLKKLKALVGVYSAPSVKDYINAKNRLMNLAREQKLLERKASIQNIKLKNITKKLKMKE